MNSVIFYSFFLPAILLLGIVTSVEDFKRSRISNKWIIGLLIYATAIYFIAWVVYFFSKSNIIPTSCSSFLFPIIAGFDKWLVNLFLGSIAAYLLWHFRIWGAGDAKLFIAYIALIPISRYPYVYISKYVSFFVLLLYIFIPATAFILFHSLFSTLRKILTFKDKHNIPGFIKAKLNKLKLKEEFRIIIGFVTIFIFLSLLTEKLRWAFGVIFPRQEILLIFILLAFQQIVGALKNNIKFFIVGWAFLALYSTYMVFTRAWPAFMRQIANALGSSLLLMFLFFLAKKIIDYNVERENHKTTSFAHWVFLGALLNCFIPFRW